MASKKVQEQKIIHAALYCRVSTVDQGRADFSSLDTQEAMLRKECEDRKWKVYKVYTDTKSGKSLDRPELIKLLQDAQEKKFDVVLATKLDRVSRSTKDFLELDEKLISLNINIIITTQNIDTTTPAGQMQRTILMAFAQFEREMIAERTRESVYARAKRGAWLGGNTILGYDIVNKQLQVNEKEADLVRNIFKWYLEKPSTRALARKMEVEGYKIKTRITKNGKKIGGKSYDYQYIHNILRNQKYIGIITYKGERFKGMHDAIVDDVLFERVQKRLDESSVDTYATYDESPLLLLGATKCGFCDANLTTYFTNNGKNTVKHYYYKCTTAKKRGPKACPSRSVPAKDLELFTEAFMLHSIKERGFFDAITSQANNNSNDELIQLEQDLQTLNGNLSSITKKIQNLMTNFSDEVVEKAAKINMMEMLERLGKQKIEIESKISNIEIAIRDIRENRFEKETLNQVLTSFDALFKESSVEEKKAMLKTIVSEIKVMAKQGEKDGTIEFKLRGNGSVLKRWEEVVGIKKRGATGVTPRVLPLRG